MYADFGMVETGQEAKSCNV